MNKEEIQKRLKAIGAQNLSALSDEEALALLEERKELQATLGELEKAVHEKRARTTKKKELETRLVALNKDIKPDLSDTELLQLIEERRSLTAELETFLPKEVTLPPEPLPEPELPEELPTPLEKPQPVVPEVTVETPATEEAKAPLGKITIEEDGENENIGRPTEKIAADEIHGSEMVDSGALDPEEYQGYIRDLQSNVNDLGQFLQSLPKQALQSKAFMLEVAKIDPAYAMHYADKETLARDEYFNLQVAGMQNSRDTGNPLSEMLPEMRTEKVVLAGVRQDYRNVRFVRPEMTNYNEIINIAKKGTLEAVSALKNSHDIRLLIPAVLQKDKAFMAEAQTKVSQPPQDAS